MANNNFFAAFAVYCLIFLSLSSAFVQQDLSISKNFDTYFNNELQLLREKRQNNLQDLFEEKHDFVKLEENLSETQTVHEKRKVEEEKISQIDDKKDKAQKKLSESKTSNDSQEIQDDAFSYRSMHDFIQALILADESGIIERLQQMQELENATESEKLSNLPKRHASASAVSAVATSNLLGGNLWDTVPLTELDAHSCEIESIEYGHGHLSGVVVHELFCELRKFWHYVLIILRNMKEGLTLGPLITDDIIVASNHGILSRLLHYIPRLFRHIIREPHHLLLLPDVIYDAVPFSSITGAIHRLKHVFFKLLHFIRDLINEHARFVLRHFFHHFLGTLRERLHALRLAKLHYFGGLHSALPLEETITRPVASVASVSTATATATTNDDVITIPDYHRSLGEVLTSLRGFYNGYVASGIPQLIRTGVKSISTSSVVSTVTSYFFRLPFLNYFACNQNAAVTSTMTNTVSTSSASAASVATPVIAPIINPTVAPVVSIAPIIESESTSASASATAVVTETQQVIAPVVSVTPTVLPCESTSIVSSDSSVATATATAATTATSPEMVPLIQPVPTLSPVIDTVENTVSASNSVSAATAVAPEITTLSTNNPGSTVTSTAAASAAVSVSSTSDVTSPLVTKSSPPSLSLLRYRPRPILSPALSAPAAASASANSVSSTGSSTLFIPNQYRKYNQNINRYGFPLLRQPILSSGAVPSSAAASAAASAASLGRTSASTASAVSLSADDFNFVLPRRDIIGALGYDHLLPGDVIAITLRNRSVLCGRVLDSTSPIRFSFLRPKLRASIIRNGRRIWNLLPRDFRNPECIQRLNNPLLLRYGQRWL